MNLKKLIEQRNAILDQIDAEIETAEKEVRSLDSDESFIELKAKASQLNEEITNLEARQKDEAKKMEEPKMEKTNLELEVRAVDQFIRKVEGEEVRALQTTAQGGAVIPEEVEGMIVQKMEETSPVFAEARKFPSTSGTLKIAKETALSAGAGFVGEGDDVQELAISLGDVKLSQKRVGAAVSLSNQLINDSAVNIVDYAVNLLSRRTAKAVENAIFNGVVANDSFKGLASETEIKEVTATAAAGITLDNLIDVYNSINPELLDGAKWYFARPAFNVIAKLKDGNDHPYLQNGVVNGKLTYTLFGAPVVVSDTISTDMAAGKLPIYFGNMNEAYGIMIKKGFAIQHVSGDTTQALRGSHLLVLDGYMDGVCYNTQAVARIKMV